MGLWSGEFVVESSSQAGIKPFKGFLRLFGNQKYQLHLENSAQGFDVTGGWLLGAKHLTLSVADIQFQNPSDLDQQTLNLKTISVSDIRTGYGRSFTLKLNSTETEMKGLSNKLGPLVGYQLFQKRHLDQG